MSAQDILKTIFGYDSFREGQEAIIASLCDGKDVLAVLPTGRGKSLCYQIPALMKNGPTLIVSPLIALMRDQVQKLKSLGVASGAMLTTGNLRLVYQELQESAKKKTPYLCYLSPERLISDQFQNFIKNIPVQMIAVDEAHCMLEWGHDFRKDYLDIPNAIAHWSAVPRIALTASVSPNGQIEIAERLLRSPDIHTDSFDRPEISLNCRKVPDILSATVREIIHFSTSKTQDDDASIVYVQSRAECEKIAAALLDQQIKCDVYHAGLDPLMRQSIEKSFLERTTHCVIATSAFGMGIDRPNVRLVLHAGMPQSIEGFYQEMGRSSRDGQGGRSLVLWSSKDLGMRSYLANVPDPVERDRASSRFERVLAYLHTTNCRRQSLLRRFGEQKKCAIPCGQCHQNGEDITEKAEHVIRLIQRLDTSATPSFVVECLTGEKTDRVLQDRAHKFPEFGLIPSSSVVKTMLRVLHGNGYIALPDEKTVFAILVEPPFSERIFMPYENGHSGQHKDTLPKRHVEFFEFCVSLCKEYGFKVSDQSLSSLTASLDDKKVLLERISLFPPHLKKMILEKSDMMQKKDDVQSFVIEI